MSAEWNAPHRSKLGRAMDAAEYDAEIASGGISAHGRNWYEVTFTFHHDYARRAGDAKVTNDLTGLLRLVFARGMAEWRRVLATETRSTPLPDTPKRVAWREERDAMAVEGQSHDGSVRVAAIGMAQWSVELAPGSCDRLDDASLSAAVTQAVAQLAEQWVTSLRALNRRHFFGGSS